MRGAYQDQPLRFMSTVNQVPAMGQRIAMARATWDTGWFQAEILRCLLENLGYVVDTPQTMDNQDFYTAVANGVRWICGPTGGFPVTMPSSKQDAVKGTTGCNRSGSKSRPAPCKATWWTSEPADRPGVSSEFVRSQKARPWPRPTIGNGNGRADLIGCQCRLGLRADGRAPPWTRTSCAPPSSTSRSDYSPLPCTHTVARYKRKAKPISVLHLDPQLDRGYAGPRSGCRSGCRSRSPACPPMSAGHGGANHCRRGRWPGCSQQTPVPWGFRPTTSAPWPTAQFLEQHPDVRAAAAIGGDSARGYFPAERERCSTVRMTYARHPASRPCNGSPRQPRPARPLAGSGYERLQVIADNDIAPAGRW
jgi:hypothetical protein